MGRTQRPCRRQAIDCPTGYLLHDYECRVPVSCAATLFDPKASHPLPSRSSTRAARGSRRAKNVLLAKPLYVAFVWSQIVVSVALTAPQVSKGTLACASGWIFAKMITNTALCDFKNIDEDRANGVGSWPVVLGVARARRLLHAVHAASALPLLVAVAFGAAPAWLAALELTAVNFAVCVQLVARPRLAPFVGNVLADLGTVAIIGSVTLVAG